MPEEKKERKIKVLCKRSIWIEKDAKPKKVNAGKVILLTAAEIKHFGPTVVTKDLPESEDE
jgi:hypothetical protein